MTLYEKHKKEIAHRIGITSPAATKLTWDNIGIDGEEEAAKACEQITLDEMEKILDWIRTSPERFSLIGSLWQKFTTKELLTSKDLIKAYYANKETMS